MSGDEKGPIIDLEDPISDLPHPPSQSFFITTKNLAKDASYFMLSRGFTVAARFAGAIILSRHNSEDLAASSLITETQFLFITPLVVAGYMVGIYAGKNHGEYKQALNHSNTNTVATSSTALVIASPDNIRERFGIIVSQGLSFASLIVIPSLSLPFIVAPILELLGQESDVAEVVAEYYRGAVWGTAPYLWFNVLLQYILKTQPKLLCAVSFINAATNVSLSYLLINGAGFIPEFGAKGLGIATSITAWLSFIGLGLIIKHQHRSQGQDLHLFTFPIHSYQYNKKKLKAMGYHLTNYLKQASAIGVEILFETGSMFFTAILAGLISRDALAAQGISSQCLTFFVTPIFGLAQVTATKIRALLSNNEFKHAKTIGYSALCFGELFALTGTLTLTLGRETIVGLFNPNNSNQQDLAEWLLIIAGVRLLSDTLRNVSAGMIRGFLDTLTPMIYSAISLWALSAPLQYLLGNKEDLGLNALNIIPATSLVCCGAALFKKFIGKKNTQITSAVTPNRTTGDHKEDDSLRPQRRSLCTRITDRCCVVM